MQLIDGAHLFAANLPGLANIPGFHDLLVCGGGIARAAPSPSYHRIDFFLVQYFVHGILSIRFRLLSPERLIACRQASSSSGTANGPWRASEFAILAIRQYPALLRLPAS